MVLLLRCLAARAFVLGVEGSFFSPAIGRDAKPLAAAALLTANYKSLVDAKRSWLVQPGYRALTDSLVV
jgi:hypothetical protein